MNNTIKFREDQLKAMHEVMCCTNDENIYDSWAMLAVPDEPLEQDFTDIAEDEEEYNDAIDLFIRLVSKKGYRA